MGRIASPWLFQLSGAYHRPCEASQRMKDPSKFIPFSQSWPYDVYLFRRIDYYAMKRGLAQA